MPQLNIFSRKKRTKESAGKSGGSNASSSTMGFDRKSITTTATTISGSNRSSGGVLVHPPPLSSQQHHQQHQQQEQSSQQQQQHYYYCQGGEGSSGGGDNSRGVDGKNTYATPTTTATYGHNNIRNNRNNAQKSWNNQRGNNRSFEDEDGSASESNYEDDAAAFDFYHHEDQERRHHAQQPPPVEVRNDDTYKQQYSHSNPNLHHHHYHLDHHHNPAKYLPPPKTYVPTTTSTTTPTTAYQQPPAITSSRSHTKQPPAATATPSKVSHARAAADKAMAARDGQAPKPKPAPSAVYPFNKTRPLPSKPDKLEDANKLITKGKYSLNDFKIMQTLGTGSFGRVHLVQSHHNQRFYAIKVLKKAQVQKMRQIEHTQDERLMLARVNHPFLIKQWGTFQDSNHLFLVMDFIEGGELFTLLRKSQRFPNPVAKFYAAEVVLAFDYLHRGNIIYRDLKPENLLLDRHGHIKVTDFGFAKEVEDMAWTLCGTPDYLAPEIILSKGYTKAVDWWSLGILIFEMLFGYTPFTDPNQLKMYENILACKVKYEKFPNWVNQYGEVVKLNADARDLLEKLITLDLSKRLGNTYEGVKAIFDHPWFAEVEWARMLEKDIDAPYVPPVRAQVGDASMFDKYPEDRDQYGTVGDDPNAKYFVDF